MNTEPTSRVSLTLQESGTLCHVLMQAFLNSGGTAKQPAWAVELYTKLALANDRLMYPKRKPKKE